MKGGRVHFSSASAEWATPQNFYAALDKEFFFTLDVACTSGNCKAVKGLCVDQGVDSLLQPWSSENCFMNPPYGEPENPCPQHCKKQTCKKRGWHVTEYTPGIIDFIQKAHDEAGEGALVVCLVPARTDTKWWAIFWDHDKHKPRHAEDEVRFVKGRLKFGGMENAAPFPSVVVVMRPRGIPEEVA